MPKESYHYNVYNVGEAVAGTIHVQAYSFARAERASGKMRTVILLDHRKRSEWADEHRELHDVRPDQGRYEPPAMPHIISKQ